MSTETHMHWYGKPNNDRFNTKVPIGFKVSLAKHLFWLNRRGKVARSQTEFLLSVIDAELAAHSAEVESFWQEHFKPKK